MTDSNATELREKLDALGIEHFDYDKGGRTQTIWESPDRNQNFEYMTFDNEAKTAKLTISWFPTPEQAIAATLGSTDKSAPQGANGNLDKAQIDWLRMMPDGWDGKPPYDVNPDGLPVGLTISDDGNLLDWCGENYVRQDTLGADDGSRWFEMFGTPERAARTITDIKCDDGECRECPLYEMECSYSEHKTLEWLRGKAVS